MVRLTGEYSSILFFSAGAGIINCLAACGCSCTTGLALKEAAACSPGMVVLRPAGL